MAKKKRKQYDDKFRASIVAMLESAGYPEKKGALTDVARYADVPMMTISRWFKAKNNPPPNELVIEKRRDLKEMIENELYAILGTMPDAREYAEYRELATAFGIMVDKLQLLNNKPTERVAVDDASLTDEGRVDRIVSILDRARARRDGRAHDSNLIQ